MLQDYGSPEDLVELLARASDLHKIDLRPENLGRRGPLHLGLVGDVGATLAALLPLIGGRRKSDRKHLDGALAHYRKARKTLDDLATGTPGRKPIHPQYLNTTGRRARRGRRRVHL